MATQTVQMLPPMAPYPEVAAWKSHIMPDEWAACFDAWVALTEAHLSLATPNFSQTSAKDDSLHKFLVSYTKETARLPDDALSADGSGARKLRKNCFLLSARLLDSEPPPGALLSWKFLADFGKVYRKASASKVLAKLWKKSSSAVETSLGPLKVTLIRLSEAGLAGDPTLLELELKRLNHLLHASPDAVTFFMIGSDFLDGLVSCYKLMNPPLRKAIITTAYLCLNGLSEGDKPNLSLLTDQLYALKSAADTHKAGPLNVNDSLVAELVTVTPVLKILQQRFDPSVPGSNRGKSVITYLESYSKAGGGRQKRLVKRKDNKGKEKHLEEDSLGPDTSGQSHIHKMSLITQVQDLFPDLGSGFVAKLLNEYNEDVEQVISHLLEDSLSPRLQSMDRSETLSPSHQFSDNPFPELAPRSTPPLVPTRRNVFDNDDFDNLSINPSKLHFGRHKTSKTADTLLSERSNAPAKAAILSALAAFDSDDDERDDTYDVEDVGGTVDSATPGNNPEEAIVDSTDSEHEETLFKAWKLSPQTFDRQAATRRGKPREALRDETKMTDEAIEGWALMLSRDPRRLKKLELRFSNFSGGQRELIGSSWKADSGTEDSDGGARGGRGGAGGRRARGPGMGRGRGRGNPAGPTGEKETEVARQRKEANKGSTANHNRRDQRARKMARGGFPS